MGLLKKIISFFKKNEKSIESKNSIAEINEEKSEFEILPKETPEIKKEVLPEKKVQPQKSPKKPKKKLNKKKSSPQNITASLKKEEKPKQIRQISNQEDLYELFTGEKNPGIKEYVPPISSLKSFKPSKNCLKESKLRPQKVYDLHGMGFTEADKKIENSLMSAKLKGLGSICFITGKGKHSRNMQPVLRDLAEKKAVELKKKGAICSFEWEKKQKKKSGSIIFYLLKI
jgi:DNA-nicking Smr family endonuclease